MFWHYLLAIPSAVPAPAVPWHGHVRELAGMFATRAEESFYAGGVWLCSGYSTLLVVGMVLHWQKRQSKRGIHKEERVNPAAALRVHQAHSQLGASRDTGFQRDIDPQHQDQMLNTHWEDKEPACQSLSSSASAWSMEHRMEDGARDGPENAPCSFCDAEWREANMQSLTFSDFSSGQHSEDMNSDNCMVNGSQIRSVAVEATLASVPELTAPKSYHFAGHPQELEHAHLGSNDLALLGLPSRNEFTTNLPATDAGGEPQNRVSSGPWSMDSGSKYGHSPLEMGLLPACITRDTGFHSDIVQQDQMLYTHCEDKDSAYQLPPSSASAWSMEHRMEGNNTEPGRVLCSLCDAESNEANVQSLTYSDCSSVQHSEDMNSDNGMVNGSQIRNAAIEATLAPVPNRCFQYGPSFPLHPPSSQSPSSQSGHSGLVSFDELSNLSPQIRYSGNVSPCQLSSPSPQSRHIERVSSDELEDVLYARPNVSHAQRPEGNQSASAIKEAGMPSNLSIVLASALAAGMWH